MEHAFLQHHGLTWDTRAPLLLRPNRDPGIGPVALAHLFAEEYVALGHISQADFERYYKFSLVRNPYDRMISEWRYRTGGQMSFQDFLFRSWPEPGFTDAFRHVEPQWKFVFGSDGALLVDDILPFETFDESVSHVLGLVGMTGITVPHVNRSGTHAGGSNADASDPVTMRIQRRMDHFGPDECAAIQERFAADFEIFGFDPSLEAPGSARWNALHFQGPLHRRARLVA